MSVGVLVDHHRRLGGMMAAFFVVVVCCTCCVRVAPVEDDGHRWIFIILSIIYDAGPVCHFFGYALLRSGSLCDALNAIAHVIMLMNADAHAQWKKRPTTKRCTHAQRHKTAAAGDGEENAPVARAVLLSSIPAKALSVSVNHANSNGRI